MAVSQVPLWPATFEAETVAIPQNPESVAVPQIPPLPNSAKALKEIIRRRPRQRLLAEETEFAKAVFSWA